MKPTASLFPKRIYVDYCVLTLLQILHPGNKIFNINKNVYINISFAFVTLDQKQNMREMKILHRSANF